MFITAPEDAESLIGFRSPPIVQSKPEATIKSKVVPGTIIVGGGGGAAHAVESLRESGYEGSITVISAEPHLPIDR